MCIVVGDEGRRVEKLSNEEIKDEIQGMLKQAFGAVVQDSQETFRPIDIHPCRWTNDPRYCGSYSVFPKGALFENNEDFYAPVKNENGTPVIHFAGEAFDKKYSAFVHGAYCSGENIANEVIKQLI